MQIYVRNFVSHPYTSMKSYVHFTLSHGNTCKSKAAFRNAAVIMHKKCNENAEAVTNNAKNEKI